MKRIILSISILTGLNVVAQNQQLPNSNFEDVHKVTVDRSGYSTPAPEIIYDSLGGGWVSGNEIFKNNLFGSSTNTVFAKDTSDASQGTHALLLRTHKTSSTNVLATGNTGLGNFVFNQLNPFQSVREGVPFTGKPNKIMGKYKYYKNDGDSCFIASILTKWNGTKRDTIATAFFVSTDEKTQYTDFSINFNYKSQDTPDSISVMFLSSKGGFVPNLTISPVGKVGATLIIDDVKMDYSAGINDLIVNQTEISTINNNIRIASKKEGTVQIISIDGKTIYNAKLYKGVSMINLNKSGVFIVNINQGNALKTQKIILK